MEEKKELKVTVDFASSLKFWLAFLLVQIIAFIVAIAVLVLIMSVLAHTLFPGGLPLSSLIILQGLSSAP